MKSHWRRAGTLSNMTGVLKRRWPCEDRGRHRRKAMWRGSRAWSNANTSQRVQQLLENLQKLGKGKEAAVPNLYDTGDRFLWNVVFPQTEGGMGWGGFQDDSRELHLLCTLFLLLLHHLHLRSSSIRFWRLGTPARRGSSAGFRGSMALPTPCVWTWASRTLRQWISIVSSHFVCCACLGQPEACCGPWGHKELDTLWLNWTELRKPLTVFSFSILWKHLSKLWDSVTMLLSDFKILNTSSDKAWCRWMSGCLWVIALLLLLNCWLCSLYLKHGWLKTRFWKCGPLVTFD